LTLAPPPAVPPPAVPPPAHPITGIQTADYGFGSGWVQPMAASYGWDQISGSLIVKVTSFSCCNTFFQGFYLMYGQNPAPPPIALPTPPFWDGSFLFIIPDVAVGLYSGNSASIPVPPDPLLVGQTFELQALGQWFTTINFSTDYGVSQATSLTFL
jgi:hypothetical protein